MSTTLSKAETKVLIAAASETGGLIQIPPGTKPASRDRMLGRFLRDGLAAESDGAHRLTSAGYKAVGLRPPRKVRVSAEPYADGQPARPATKQTLVRELLARPEGATLDELVAATGWLPHTTRAALCRIRKADPLAKSARPDGKAAYRLEVAADAEAGEPAKPDRKRKAASAELQAAA